MLEIYRSEIMLLFKTKVNILHEDIGNLRQF